MGRATVDAVLADYRAAPISAGLKTTLAYLEIMTLRPEKLTEGDARAVLDNGISAESLTDAIAIGSVFNLIARYASALDFSVPTPARLHRLAETLVKVGYPS
jgi:alkylhydroperoxidase family enzyme